MTLFRYVAARALRALLAALAAAVLIFLVVDFAENASAFHGPGWVGAALALYAHRAAVVAYQVAPAAMLLAAAITAGELRRTREQTALASLGLGPWRVAAPVLAVAAGLALALAGLHDRMVVDAGQAADAILAGRFHRASAFSAEPAHWFRGHDGRRIYHLAGHAGGDHEAGFGQATVLELAEPFRLARRIDAARMTPLGGGDWSLEGVTERTFAPDGSAATQTFDRRTYHFDEAPGAFDVRPGRPSQLHRAALDEQVELRRRLGLPSRPFALEAQQRLAYPLAAIPAALLALGVALRRGRKGHLTAALVEAVAISFAFWCLQGLCSALGLAGHLPPAAAAWAPDALLLGAGLVAMRSYA